MVPNLRTGSSTASFRRQSGGTISFSPEATCSSSGRRKKFASGARNMDIHSARSCGLTNCGRWRRPGIPPASRRIRAAPSRTRCARSFQVWVWRGISGIRNRTGLAENHFFYIIDRTFMLIHVMVRGHFSSWYNSQAKFKNPHDCGRFIEGAS